jgi:hypothetical protein
VASVDERPRAFVSHKRIEEGSLRPNIHGAGDLKKKKNGGNFWFVCLLIVESSGVDGDWGGGERYGISGY